jgi:hypothetical protein
MRLSQKLFFVYGVGARDDDNRTVLGAFQIVAPVIAQGEAIPLRVRNDEMGLFGQPQ